jgi:hypothetical protein
VTVRRRIIYVLAGIGLVILPALAGAQGSSQPGAAPSARVGATIFYDYTFTNTPRSTDAEGSEFRGSAFEVKRAYINITGSLSPVVSFRVTPDVRRETGSGGSLDGSLTFRLKYAYAQFSLDQWMRPGSRIRAGVIQTPYIESQEGVYRYRFQGTVFVERDGGQSSADAGVSFRTPLPDRYGDVQVGLYNGEGYSQPDANGKVSVQVMATVRPFAASDGPAAGLRATAFYDHGYYVQNTKRRRFFANAMVEHARFNAGVDVVVGSDQTRTFAPEVDSTGVSFFVTPFFQEKGRGFEGLLRYDRYSSDSGAADGTRNRVIVGGAYWFPNTGSAQAALLVDFEQVTASGGLFASERKQQRISLHGLINF